MLDSIGWGEVIVLLLAALFIFGPERLPDLARDAAAGMRRVRGAITGVRGQMSDTLGPEFDQFTQTDLRQYHPRTMLRRALTEDAEDTEGRSASAEPALDDLAGGRARVMGPPREDAAPEAP